MKQITTQANITSLTAKVDGSLGMRVVTPELSNEEKTEFFNIQNKNIILTITPIDEPFTESVEVKSEVDEKTPSQRLRGVLFILWKQEYQDKYGTFNEFYQKTMERIIDQYKLKLD